MPDAAREGLLLAYREMLLTAIEQGAGRVSGQFVDVAAIRTQPALVCSGKNPGRRFEVPRLPAGVIADGTVLADLIENDAGSGDAEAYRLLVARTIVDEMSYNEHANEAIPIKHSS